MLRTPRHRDMLYESPFVRDSLQKTTFIKKQIVTNGQIIGKTIITNRHKYKRHATDRWYTGSRLINFSNVLPKEKNNNETYKEMKAERKAKRTTDKEERGQSDKQKVRLIKIDKAVDSQRMWNRQKVRKCMQIHCEKRFPSPAGRSITRVGDPWHFGSDPDPRISASD